jgi:integrase
MGKPKFLIQGKKNPSPIYVRYSVSRKIDIKVRTKWVINPANWSKSKQRPKHLHDEQLKIINNGIDALEGKIINAYNRRDDDSEITKNWLNRIISNSHEVSKGSVDAIPKLVIPYIDYYIKQKIDIGSVTPNTIKTYNSHKNRILKFQDSTGEEFRFKNIDLNFQQRFNKFSLESKYAKNESNKIMKWLKQVANHAASNQIEISPQLNQIAVSFEPSLMVYLTPAEIVNIANAQMPHDYLDNARDWLIIACETGQRVSDFLKFNINQIFNPPEAEKRTYIEFVQKKTQKKMEIPLTNKVLEILEKRNFNFPRQISDVKFNEYIKIVAKIAKIDTPTLGALKDVETNRNIVGTYPKYKLITSKVARRSFCTNNYGIRDTIKIMYMSGHTTEKALQTYIGKTDSEKRKLLSDW